MYMLLFHHALEVDGIVKELFLHVLYGISHHKLVTLSRMIIHNNNLVTCVAVLGHPQLFQSTPRQSVDNCDQVIQF